MRRRVGIDFEDPEAQDAVGDLQVVVERVEQIGRRLEAEPAVVGLGALVDFVGHLAEAPGVLLFEGCRRPRSAHAPAAPGHPWRGRRAGDPASAQAHIHVVRAKRRGTIAGSVRSELLATVARRRWGCRRGFGERRRDGSGAGGRDVFRDRGRGRFDRRGGGSAVRLRDRVSVAAPAVLAAAADHRLRRRRVRDGRGPDLSAAAAPVPPRFARRRAASGGAARRLSRSRLRRSHSAPVTGFACGSPTSAPSGGGSGARSSPGSRRRASRPTTTIAADPRDPAPPDPHARHPLLKGRAGANSPPAPRARCTRASGSRAARPFRCRRAGRRPSRRGCGRR